MKTLPFKTVEVKLSQMELASFREKFGDIYWNETENIIFIPVDDYINGHHYSAILKFYNFFSGVDRDVKGIYINCNEVE